MNKISIDEAVEMIHDEKTPKRLGDILTFFIDNYDFSKEQAYIALNLYNEKYCKWSAEIDGKILYESDGIYIDYFRKKQ